MGHHPHLYAFTFSNYFLSRSSSLTVFALPELSPNHSILFLLYSFCVKNRFFGFFLLLIKEADYFIWSGSITHFTLLLFNGPGLSPALLCTNIRGNNPFSSPINSYGEQVLVCLLPLRAAANYQYSPLSPPLFMGVTVWRWWACGREMKPNVRK